MTFLKLTLKNFYRFGNNEQSVDLTGHGITLLTAQNGVGKSSIVEAIKFALFGKTRQEKIDEVVNRYTKKNCKVSLEIEDNGVIYKIIRYRLHEVKGNKVFLFKNDEDITGHTDSDTNSLISDIVKVSYVGFINSTIFSSEDYDGFLNKRESDRLVVFENLLSLKEVNEMYVAAKEIIKELNKEREEICLSKTGVEAEISAISNTVTEYSNNVKSKLLLMKAEISNLNNEIESLELKLKELNSIDVEEEKKKLENNNLKEEYETKIKALEEERSSITIEKPVDALRIIDKYKDVDFYNNKNKEEKFKEDTAEITKRENEISLLAEKIDKLKTKKVSLSKEKEVIEKEIIELNRKIESLNSSTCPFCGQHLVSEKAEEELKKANDKLLEDKKINELKNSELISIDEEIFSESENYESIVKFCNKLKENLDKSFIPNSDLIEQQYNNAVDIVKNYEKNNSINSKRIVEINKEITEYKEKLKNLKFTFYTMEELNELGQKIQKAEDDIKNKKEKINIINGSAKTMFDKSYVDGLKKQIADKQESLKSVDVTLNNIDLKLKHYDYLSVCFSNKGTGFKKHFIGEMIDFFNTKINNYLPFLFNEKVTIEFNKDLTETIKMEDEDATYKSFSQGQRQRAELAIAFALFDVARLYFGNNNKILFLDELDKGLDKYGCKSMVNLLRGFDEQLKIFIISHNEEIKEEIPDKLVLEKDSNDFTKIVY